MGEETEEGRQKTGDGSLMSYPENVVFFNIAGEFKIFFKEH